MLWCCVYVVCVVDVVEDGWFFVSLLWGLLCESVKVVCGVLSKLSEL